MFCSCLPIGHDWGVGGEVERFGLERGGLGELLEGAGVAVQAGGVPGLGGELGEQRAVAVRGVPGAGPISSALSAARCWTGRLSRPGPG